jgi:hypothetical protein
MNIIAKTKWSLILGLMCCSVDGREESIKDKEMMGCAYLKKGRYERVGINTMREIERA